MDKSDNFRKTLQLPNTSFPMKARLQEKEPEIIENWKNNKIHEKLMEKRKNSPYFFLQDGPPYANGKIHLGHVLNKILKDIVIKYKNLSGFKAPFIPTWDCHGLPIELSVLKKMDTKQKISSPLLRQKCRSEASHWIKIQQESFERLGIIADWNHPLLTMDPSYEAEEVRALAHISKKGLLYRGTKPVFWCFKLQTATAFSEAVYKEHKSPSIYVKFNVAVASQKILNSKKPTSVIIWTTTPWTLPANSAIALHRDFDYGLYEDEQESYIIATKLEESFIKEVHFKPLKKIKTFKGKDLEGLSTNHPFLDRKSPLVLGDHVNLETGTGCVHTAPGHGLEDYLVGKKYKLKEYCPVDARGHFTEDLPEDLRGLFIFKGNKIILEKLKKSGHLVAEKEIQHTYPYNPRSNSPLIYRLTPQWFLALDQEPKSIRSQAIRASDRSIKFIPDWGKKRLDGMLKNSPDWCLTRQRVWGVPLVVFYCNNCSTPLLNSKIINSIADKMEESKEGIEYYFSREVTELLPQDTKCESCKGKNFKKGYDILDVWFDSGIQHAVFKTNKNYKLPFPADLFLEGSDQHRGWFQTSLISSLAIDNTVPFKTLLTHGFVNDKDGRKMSKSKGNVLDPFEIIKKSGSEILRLWVSSENYNYDISAGNHSLERVTETYRRFRNTFRFLLGNLNAFDFKKEEQNYETLNLTDKWALSQLNQLILNCKESFDNFAFYKVYHYLNQFFTVTLSAFYLDIIKDRLYTFGKNSQERKSAQTVLYHLLDCLLPLMAPLTSFLCEEAHGYFSGKKEESIFLKDFPEINPKWKNPEVENLFERLFVLREDLNKQIESLRKDGKLGSNLEACATLYIPKNFLIPQMKEQELFEFFSVSKVEIIESKEASIKSHLAKGEKCLRCWFYNESLNSDKICPKCSKNLSL